jgi:hypothetical protein
LSTRKTPSALRHNDLRRGPFGAMLRCMSRRIHVLGSAFNMIGGLIGVLGWLLRFAWLMLASKAVLAARLLALQSELVTCTDAIEHGRRTVRHWATTYHPTMSWVIQQLRNAMPWGEQPRFMHRDNDGVYGLGVPAFLEGCGVEEVRTAFRSPWQNPFVERLIGTLRRELLDHVIPLSQSHLERLLREFIEDYYHIARPHQGLGGETPVPHEAPDISGPARLVSTPVLGGLHHTYHRVAA